MERQLQKIKQQIADKVEGRWVPEHDQYGHHYREVIPPASSVHVKKNMEGVLQDSVTTKLGILNKPHLLRWAVRIGIEFLEREDRFLRLDTLEREELLGGAMAAHTDIRDDAGSIGTVAHDAAELYIKEWIATGIRPQSILVFIPAGSDPRSIACTRGLEQLFIKKDIIPVASELLVGHPKLSAGTLDFLCFWEGKLTLVDFKTSNQVDKVNYPLQVAAYMYFFRYMIGKGLTSFTRAKIIHLSKDSAKFEVWKVNYLPEAYEAFKAVCKIYDWIFSRTIKVERDVKRIII